MSDDAALAGQVSGTPPLSLPVGSVRALITLAVLATVWAQLLRRREVGREPQDTLLLVLGYYSGARATGAGARADALPVVAARETPPRDPLFLPRGVIRLLIVLGSGAVAWRLHERGSLLVSPPPLLVLVGMFLAGALAKGLLPWPGGLVTGRVRDGLGHALALVTLHRAAQADPSLHDVRALLALDRGRRGELDASIAELGELERVAPASFYAAHFRALGLRGRGDWAGVVAAESRALALEPRDADAWYYRAEARLALGDLDGAVADLDQALELTRGQPHRQRGIWPLRARARLLQGDHVGALEDARRAVDAGGDARELVGAAARIKGLDPDLADGFSALTPR